MTFPALSAPWIVPPFHPQTGTREFCSRVPESNQLNAEAYGRGGGVGRGLGVGVGLGATLQLPLPSLWLLPLPLA